jgi:hypothetical protein
MADAGVTGNLTKRQQTEAKVAGPHDKGFHIRQQSEAEAAGKAARDLAARTMSERERQGNINRQTLQKTTRIDGEDAVQKRDI